jgi:hypothetical protein
LGIERGFAVIIIAPVDRTLDRLLVRAWRLHLETPGVLASVPMIRGVWGAALRAESETSYRSLFEVSEPGVPRYVLRPAPPDAEPAPALEFLLYGHADPVIDAAVWAAWDRAADQGLGPDRRPFRIVATVPLAWDETPLRPARVQPGFALAPLPWPIPDVRAGCRLEFPAPLRLIRHGQLIREPAPPDLAIAALRRICALVGPAADPLWLERHEWLEIARTIPSRSWQGSRLDLVRYSGSQRREIDLQGVAGTLDLPAGPGPLGPLLAASQWLHLGKGTVMGLGQLRIAPLDDRPISDATR